MKKTKKKAIYPLNRGLDRNSVPGTQDAKSLQIAKNISLRSRPSIIKRPGLRRLDYTGSDSGVQGAIQFFGTFGSSQYDEVVRVRDGRVEVIRDGIIHDLGTSVSNSDTVTFEVFSNALIIHFENSRPVYYVSGASEVVNLEILASHIPSPPKFSRSHDFRLVYSGRYTDPHKIWLSAVNDIQDYTLRSGGRSMRIFDGDNDPVGVTGISPVFRGDLYVTKWAGIARVYRSNYGYGIDKFSDEVGCVHHNTICATPNDLYFVSTSAIHSMVMTDKYGAAEEATITYPIYEYFQNSVNWSNHKSMKMVYDPPSSSLLLSYTSAGSTVNDRVLGYNILTKEFYEWHDCEYTSISKYYDFGIKKTMVHDNERGTCLLDNDTAMLDNKTPINMEIETGQIFPLNNPLSEVTFTNAWLIAKPTDKSVLITVGYSLDGKEWIDKVVDSSGGGYGSEINEEGDDYIGDELIGENRDDVVIMPFECEGDGAAIRFNIKQEPPADDLDQFCEIYGIVYEFEDNEDSLDKTQI